MIKVAVDFGIDTVTQKSRIMNSGKLRISKQVWHVSNFRSPAIMKWAPQIVSVT